jgi:hypothetical protein
VIQPQRADATTSPFDLTNLFPDDLFGPLNRFSKSVSTSVLG